MANWASVASLGDPSQPDWQANNLTWIEPVKGQRWQVYKPAAQAFQGLLGDLAKEGYSPTSSGGFNYRNISGGNKLSQHAFGTAIDVNADQNPQGGATSNLPADTGDLAKKWGLEWGGNWKNRPDPMHFEYTGTDPSPMADPNKQWVSSVWNYAKAVSDKTGIDPRLIVAQAAQETGWGKSAPNNNYFGIKGPGATNQTLEFINGKMQPVQADFRTYKSPEESFSDYGSLLMGSRYADVRAGKTLEEQVAALGKSGYASDPNYAANVLKIAQGIPVGGYGTPAPGQPGGAMGPPNPPGWTPPGSTPTTAPAAPSRQDLAGQMLGSAAKGWDAAGGFGGPAPASSLASTAMPKASRIDTPEMPTFDPNQIAMQRQKLAMAMQRLNTGRLW